MGKKINEVRDVCMGLSHRIDALDEAICPQVAARLTKLERGYAAFAADQEAKLKALDAIGNLGNRIRDIEAKLAAPPMIFDTGTIPEFDISKMGQPQWSPALRAPNPDLVAQKLYERDLVTARAAGENVELAETWIDLQPIIRAKIVDAAEELIAIVQSS